MLDTIRKMIRGSADAPPSAAALAEALDRLDADIVRSRNTIAKLDEQRADAVLDGDGAAKALRLRIAAETENLTDLAAARSRIAQRLAAAQASEAEVERRRQYDAAKAQIEAARKKLAGYAKARRDILEIVRLIAEADQAAEAVNANLPADATPLPEVEAVRDLPGRAAEIVSERRVQRWMPRGGGDVLPTEREADLVIEREGEGYVIRRRPIGDGRHFDQTRFYFVRREMIERTVNPVTPAVAATRLRKMALPAPDYRTCDFETQRSDASAAAIIRAVEAAGGPSGIEPPESGETTTLLLPAPAEPRAA